MTKVNKIGNDEIKNKQELIDYFRSRETRPGEELIGTEHEKIVVDNETKEPPPYWGYEDDDGNYKAGIRDLMVYFIENFGWKPVDEHGEPVDHTDPKSLIIGLERNDASISLEPAGQYELSGAPLQTLHAMAHELDVHLTECEKACNDLGLTMIATGTNPTKSFGEVPIMPKERYEIMLPYMDTQGGHGKNAMTDTTTVQVNLGYTSEQDMVKKLRVALSLQPVATAMFANSPFTDGKPNGYQSIRSHYWTDTNPKRTGMLDVAFEDDFGYEKYIDWVLDNVGVYYGHVNNKFIPLKDPSFRDFANGKIDELNGEKATISDWANHLAGIWTEARLKPPIIEMRGSDNGTPDMIKALPALWVGILYDEQALNEAYDLIKDWTNEDRHKMRREVPKTALKTPFTPAGQPDIKTVQDVAAKMVQISYGGLKRRAEKLKIPAETKYLAPLQEIVLTGRTPADRLLDNYNSFWAKDITVIFNDLAYGTPHQPMSRSERKQHLRSETSHNAIDTFLETDERYGSGKSAAKAKEPANDDKRKARKKKRRLGKGMRP